jgi:spermidine/putrescine transport system permease protein
VEELPAALVIAPFFVTYLIRTLAWQTILADEGMVMDVLRDDRRDGRERPAAGHPDRRSSRASRTTSCRSWCCRSTRALERLDTRLIEAANDLYASPVKAFLRITLPLSLPGVFAGTLLTFIPAAGDFINAELLGTRTRP